jgi:hypothetical protein
VNRAQLSLDLAVAFHNPAAFRELVVGDEPTKVCVPLAAS